jgi:hypothetical protein
MDKNTVTTRNGGELAERELRVLTQDETALVGGGFPWLIAIGIAWLVVAIVASVASEPN